MVLNFQQQFIDPFHSVLMFKTVYFPGTSHGGLIPDSSPPCRCGFRSERCGAEGRPLEHPALGSVRWPWQWLPVETAPAEQGRSRSHSARLKEKLDDEEGIETSTSSEKALMLREAGRQTRGWRKRRRLHKEARSWQKVGLDQTGELAGGEEGTPRAPGSSGC